MQQTHYGTLDIPSTATQAEIREAYRRQLDRVGGGLLPRSSLREIERAYATLGNPYRRLSYDAELASRRTSPVTRLASSHPLVLLAGMAAGAALTTAISLALALPGHTMKGPSATTLARVQPPSVVQTAPPPAPVAQTETPAPAPEQAAASPSPAPDVAAEPSPAVAQQPAPVAAAPIRTVAAPPAAVSARRSPVYVPVSADAASYAGAYQYSAGDTETAAADDQPEVSAEPEQDTPSADVQPAPVVQVRPVPALSSAFGGSRTAARIGGWYCSDATGGQVFVAAGSPVPYGVTCTGLGAAQPTAL